MGVADMSLVLKQDWTGKGKSKNVADALNSLAYQLNNANVPSGGTAVPTATGFQIEVDNDADDQIHQFQVTTGATIEAVPAEGETPEVTASISVDISAGWWAYYYSYTEGESSTVLTCTETEEGVISCEMPPEPPVLTGRVQVDLADTNLIVSETGFIILKIDVVNNLLTVIASDEVPVDEVPVDEDTVDEDTEVATRVYYKKLATVTVVDDIITEIAQHWKGGNILSTLSLAESEGVNDGAGGEDGEPPEGDCDQNTHPSEPIEEDEDEYPPDEEDGGGGGDEEEDPGTGHPSDPDCYSTIPDPIP
jgi:hypothetical protein